MADEFRDLALSSKHDLHALHLRGPPAVFQEFFHTPAELLLEEVLELHVDAEVLVLVGEEANVDDAEHVLGLGYVRCAHHDDKVLLCPRSEFQCDAFCQLLADGVFDIPSLVLALAVRDSVEFGDPSSFEAEGRLGLILNIKLSSNFTDVVVLSDGIN